ncbi:uncharacterized protein LOC113977032 [Neopelma chrysocephalum]|uniref:uncharacterized protein LOC113977032 n=1 Tax=Neopelma chrysocephalum TaxID=114329 RepID=UPI000FCD111C|nr:uncharacterized protein LOC113977032 [Neopelma chrysocephalum]
MSARAGSRLLLAGPPRRHRVSGPDPERLRLFQRLRAAAAAERRDGPGDGDGAGGGAGGGRLPPGTPIRIALPGGHRLDGRALQTTPFQVAAQLGGGLAEAALVARVNGVLQDLDRPLEHDSDLELLDFSSPEGREAFWHSSACVLGAVAEQFFGGMLCSAWATEDGFYCDVHMGDRTVQSAELPALEEACAAFARARHRFERLEATRQQLAELLKHNSFQLQQLEEEVTSPTATVYRCGPLLQLCRGPLLRHTGLIGALRVLTSSAALWGGLGGQSLQRVAAVSFPTPEALERWERAQEEAALRDHRRIGRAAALDALRPRMSNCCRHHAPLPCARRAWTDVLDGFCTDEFGVKTRQFHCCRRHGAARRRCFAQETPAPAWDPNTAWDTKTAWNLVTEPPFPPGEPTAANLGNICGLRELRPGPPGPGAPSGPRVRLRVRLEREFGRCCRNESLSCAHSAVMAEGAESVLPGGVGGEDGAAPVLPARGSPGPGPLLRRRRPPPRLRPGAAQREPGPARPRPAALALRPHPPLHAEAARAGAFWGRDGRVLPPPRRGARGLRPGAAVPGHRHALCQPPGRLAGPPRLLLVGGARAAPLLRQRLPGPGDPGGRRGPPAPWPRRVNPPQPPA